jgi:hypothetical protein
MQERYFLILIEKFCVIAYSLFCELHVDGTEPGLLAAGCSKVPGLFLFIIKVRTYMEKEPVKTTAFCSGWKFSYSKLREISELKSKHTNDTITSSHYRSIRKISQSFLHYTFSGTYFLNCSYGYK